MGRRKQEKPHRSVGIVGKNDKAALYSYNVSENQPVDKSVEMVVDRSCWVISNEPRRDLSEVVLSNLELGEGFSGHGLCEGFYLEDNYVLRFRLRDVDSLYNQIKLGHWPVFNGSSILLEFVRKDMVEDEEREHSILSGSFDGPDEGLSGLVHLVSLRFLTLRPVMGENLTEEVLSVRVRVEVLQNAFDACESLLDNTRANWRKSMMNVMAWLRPEVLTSEVRYRMSSPTEIELDSQADMGNVGSIASKRERFDAAGFYEAIKPSK